MTSACLGESAWGSGFEFSNIVQLGDGSCRLTRQATLGSSRVLDSHFRPGEVSHKSQLIDAAHRIDGCRIYELIFKGVRDSMGYTIIHLKICSRFFSLSQRAPAPTFHSSLPNRRMTAQSGNHYRYHHSSSSLAKRACELSAIQIHLVEAYCSDEMLR